MKSSATAYNKCLSSRCQLPVKCLSDRSGHLTDRMLIPNEHREHRKLRLAWVKGFKSFNDGLADQLLMLGNIPVFIAPKKCA